MNKFFLALGLAVAMGPQVASATSPVLRDINVSCNNGRTSVSISAQNMDFGSATVSISNPQTGFISEPANGSLDLHGRGVLRFKEVAGRVQLFTDAFGRLFVSLSHPSIAGTVPCQRVDVR